MCGVGRSGSGNHQNVGYDGLTLVLRESFEQARAMSGVAAASITGAGFGVAGYDFPSDRDAHLQSIAALGLACPREVVNDGWNGLGAQLGNGVNVTAGSSNNSAGETGMEKRRIVGTAWIASMVMSRLRRHSQA
jgi:N-acetylglucosamine kinase-like BadF-type ATPase